MSNPPGPEFRNRSGLRRARPEFGSSSQPSRRSKRLSANTIAKLVKESASGTTPVFEPKRLTLFKHVLKRELYGFNDKPIVNVVSKHLSRTMPTIFKEHEIDLGEVNKVFAAQWVNDSQVVMGTKCNKIIIKNVYNDDTIVIPSLKGTGSSQPAECPCGIHAISINPSGTLLATGADNTNDLAVYRLPSFDPVLLGERGHTDWIFDLKWVDDEYCFTGSRDSKMAVWKVVDNHDDEGALDRFITGSGAIPTFGYEISEPVDVKVCHGADKIRALAYNSLGMEMGILSLNSRIHTWDVTTFQQKESKKLPNPRETVCMTYDPAKQVYAVGSQSHVTLMDRDLKPVFNIESLQKGHGIRSVSFNENIVTIGTGLGSILFYDLNAGKYLECSCGHCRHTCILKSGPGYLLRDRTWRDYFAEYDYHNAIYAHCYDASGVRLFAAGGPLPAGLVGNYAGLWQ